MRVGRWALLATSVALLAPAGVKAERAAPTELTLFADRDDDDDDGVPDGDEAQLNAASASDVRWLRSNELAAQRSAPAILSPLVRFVADGRPVSRGAGVTHWQRQIGLQALAPGRTPLWIAGRAFDVSVVEFAAYDAHGSRVDLATSHASISRVLPAFLSNDSSGASDLDALRWVAIGEAESLPSEIELVALAPDGRELDRLFNVELWEMPCPPALPAGASCRGTPLIRATADRIDRAHPESAGRSLRAEVGGKLLVRARGQKAASIRVGGPRRTAVGAIERLRAHLNVHVLRASAGGPVALGGDDALALERVRGEVQTASLLWGQCGVHFGPSRELAIRVLDPPPPFLLAIGCGAALPASGGELRVRTGKHAVRVRSEPGEVPLAVASRVAAAFSAQGLDASVSRNPRSEPAALETADVLVRDGEGPVALERDGAAPLSTDPSLGVCIGAVDFADGLEHFNDYDAAAGTLEERTLVLAYADRDPATIDVFVVPAFSGIGRVGESFIDTAGAAIHNTVIVDRAAILAGARSHVLAHEIGHILLNMPGHPDDYGVDQPSALMDSDATDPSIFGPRRLSIEECERAVRERGPTSRGPLLTNWPLITRAR